MATGSEFLTGANPYLAAGQLALGAVQTGVALYKLNELKKQPIAQYSDNIAPFRQNVSMYEDRMRTGLDQNTIDVATSSYNDQTASTYRRIQDVSGGQGAAAFARIAAMDRVRLSNSLAGMSAQERRNAMASLAQSRMSYAQQMNRDIAARQQRRMAEEQALGGALKAGTYNLQQGFDYTVIPRLSGGSGASPSDTFATPGVTPEVQGTFSGFQPQIVTQTPNLPTLSGMMDSEYNINPGVRHGR